MTSPRPAASPSGDPGWVVLREGRAGRWGGELRRKRIFEELARRTDARMVEAWNPRLLRVALRGPLGIIPGPILYRLPGARLRPRLASSEKLRGRLLDAARWLSDPAIVAVYDDPLAQAQALGVPLEPDWAAEQARRQVDTVATFRWLVVPTGSFAELIGLDRDRVIVGGNGTDPVRIQPGPWPDVPCIGVVSAAAPSRGLETLVEAVRLARSEVPELELRMWLVATGAALEPYLANLRRLAASQTWVAIETAPYDGLGAALASATILAIPHPPSDYMDVALPVKLFDSAAAGRPLVVTPRRETAALVTATGIGVVARGDGPEYLADAFVRMLSDEQALRAMGARAREVAVQQFDWHVVGGRIAAAALEREQARAGQA